MVYLKKRGLKIYNLNYDGESREAVIGVLFGLVVICIYGLFNLLLSILITDLPNFTFNYTPLNLILIITGNVIIMPLGTELLYRGAVQRSLKARLKKRDAILMQSAVFLINTVNLTIINNLSLYIGFITVFMMGVILGYLRDKWGLESSIMTHVTINAIGCLIWILKPLFLASL
jgi:membrane protease YdiL (CAAX protease family)